MIEVQEGFKWWYFDQNNSGGYFILNEDVLEGVFIQARNSEEAEEKAEVIFEDYSEYCPCCGPRWSTYCTRDGDDVPMLYSEPITGVKRALFQHFAVLYFANGDRKYFSYGKGFVSFEEVNKEHY